MVKIGLLVSRKIQNVKLLTDDRRRPIAIGHMSAKGDLKIMPTNAHTLEQTLLSSSNL